MHILRSIICLVILVFSFASKAIETIGIEVKEYDNIDAFVFYHTDYFKLNIAYLNGVVKITADHPIKFRKLTPVSINTLASNLRSENDKTISFTTKEPYQNFEVINGEKLTAIRFKTEKKFDKIDQKIQALNKLEHNSTNLQNQNPDIPKEANNVKIKKTKDGIEFKFEFKEKVAVGSFLRGNKLWVGFNQKESFSFPTSESVKSPFFIDSENATIFSLEIPPNLFPSIKSSENSWILTLQDKKTPIKKKIKITKLLDHYGVHLEDRDLKNAINFKDPEIGDFITLVTTTKQNKATVETRYFNDFVVYASVAGAGISWVIDNFNTRFPPTGAEVFSINNAIFTDKEDAKQENSTEEFDASTSSLPFSFLQNNKNDFLRKRASLYRNLALADVKKADPEKYNLAKFFFSETMLPEALGALQQIEFTPEFLKNNPESPIFKAVILSMLEKYKESEEILKPFLESGIKGVLKAETTIWSNYNKYKLGENIDLIGISKYINDFLTNYPDYLYWPLIVNEFELATKNNNHSTAEQLFRSIRTPTTVENEDSLNYFKATFYRKSGKNSLANNYYDSIKTHKEDYRNYVQAELDQTDMLLKSGQIKTEEAILRLEKLKYLWRGDELEYRVLMKRAEFEESIQNFIPALRTYKYVLDSFPNSSGSVYITHQMADIYNNFIFTKGGVADEMPDFDLVALFYEFRELTPIGGTGDKIVLMVTRRLINLDLLDEAEQILSHQIKYRLSGKDRIITGDHLAAVYIMNKKPKLAIDILNDTDLINFGFLEHLTRQRLKAKAFLDAKNYSSALEILQSDDSTDARLMKEEAYFKSGAWENYALIAESSILPLISADKMLPENHEKEALRLAISYSMMNRLDDLKMINSKLKTYNQTLKDAISFISLTNNPINVEKLESKFNIWQVDKYFDSIVDKLFDFK